MVAKVGAALLVAASAVAGQVLQPVTLNNGAVVKRGGVTFAMDHELDMEYADMESYNASDVDTFGATVHITTVNPAVQTEDFGNLVTDITCSNNNTMTMTFANDDAANQAKSQWTADKMTIITYTSTCNEDDERVPWVVSKPTFDGKVATLPGYPSDWKTESSAMTFSFGSKGNITNPDAVNAAPSKRDTGSTQGNMAFSFKDKTIYPSNLFNQLPVSVPVPNQLTQICVDCSNSGTVKFSGKLDVKQSVLQAAGKIGNTVQSVSNNAATKVASVANTVETKAAGIINTITDPFKNIFKRDDPWTEMASKLDVGTIGITLDGVKGHFEFQSRVYAGNEFSVPLLGKGGISPIQVKGIFSIGPSLNPTLVFKFDAEDDLTFNYGFEYTLPDGAGLDLNLMNPGKSVLHNLDKISVKALPFSTNAKEVAAKGITFSVAFRPEFSIGADILGETINPVEVYIDAPKFDGTAKLLSDVGKDCKGEGSTTAFEANGSFSFSVGIGADIALGSIAANPQFNLGSKNNLWPQSVCKAIKAGKTSKTSKSGKAGKTSKTASKSKAAGGQDADEADSTTTTTAAVVKNKGQAKTPAAADATPTPASGASKSKSKSNDAADATITPDPADELTRRHARQF